MADPKPKDLPVPGTGLTNWVTGSIGLGYGRSNWKWRVEWVGYFPGLPNIGNGIVLPGGFGTPADRPYTYRAQVMYQKQPSNAWVTTAWTNWPKAIKGGPTAGTWTSGRSPQNAYKWKPSTKSVFNGKPGQVFGPYGGPVSSTGKTNIDKITSGLNAATASVKAGAKPIDRTVPEGYTLTRITAPIKANPPLHRFTNGFPSHVQNRYPDSQRLGSITAASSIYNNPTSPFKFSKRWRFQFLYNPTYYGYSMAVDLSVDPSQVAASFTDPSGLAGNGQWPLELYINRIADLRPQNYGKYGFYPPGTDQRDIRDIWRRGTEADIEYLYRAINGDPKTTHSGRVTANFGYLFQQRVILHIGGNDYIGVIGNIEVNHVLMTEKMIPTLSKVNISFQQYQDVKK